MPRVGLISSAMDGSLVATDFNKCQVVRTFEGHTRGLYAMDWCGAEKFMVRASANIAHSCGRSLHWHSRTELEGRVLGVCLCLWRGR